MRLSRYFLPTMKETPAEAAIASHRLMLRAGMIRQSAAGIYTWLPLGKRVLDRIERIVHQEQVRAGAIEVLMPTIQSADLWRESGRYDDYGKEMLRITDRHDRDLLYGPTNEELITDIFRREIKSYKDLPKNLYHVQWKFRDEIRPRFGVMRGREFLMKDAYSFDLDEASARTAYQTMFAAYIRTFARMGLKAIPMKAETGPIGGDLSHEFVILADQGESAVFFDAAFHEMDPLGETVDFGKDALEDLFRRWTGLYAATDEIHDPDNHPVAADRLLEGRGIEVGHIFNFGTKYSEPMGATVQGPEGETVPVQMGSYGIGVSRLVGGIIEASHDDNGIIWPESVAPFDVGLINLKPADAACTEAADGFYRDLQEAGLDVLHDDRDERPGGKFKDMDLIGLPWQIVVGPRGLAAGVVELKHRASGEKRELPFEEARTLLMDRQQALALEARGGRTVSREGESLF
ncbi:proline--tRNA ligase [Yunchengibacter salinarum]|uniref:proline--tRNA ligase n=1 Tax=Yunchengibacter salinarum TaxID=3133399 RepID=UPI0035B6AA9E